MIQFGNIMFVDLLPFLMEIMEVFFIPQGKQSVLAIIHIRKLTVFLFLLFPQNSWNPMTRPYYCFASDHLTLENVSNQFVWFDALGKLFLISFLICLLIF